MLPRTHLAFRAAVTPCWSCPASHPPAPQSSSPGLLSIPSSPSLCWHWGLPPPRGSTLHLVLLNLVRFPWATSPACPGPSGWHPILQIAVSVMECTIVGWHGYVMFGSGTKLIVSSKSSSAPANSEILQKQHDNQMIYVCLIEKFYPGVIRVTWTDEEKKEVTDNVVRGDTWKPTEEGDYSIASWLTVPAENKDKNYYCKYEHESQQRSLPTHESSMKNEPQEANCSTVFNGDVTLPDVLLPDHLMHRAAYLVYIILLLKSSMYYFVILFFIYRMWASNKHQGKKV
ncbi:T-cell receptor gamma alternate reading frame protein isoform X1 [Pithys albifrons albifrons]|uniref:T-cell receptor gamma alternate reading frame protein isoform X1 n=1 Tax=Pithys albifrons albifrons TaxID=3385563 RepID=UPI003A5CE3E1